MADPIVTCLSLCSGVGGLELGLRLALGDRLHVVGHVEREVFAAAVLLARMEDQALEPAPVWCGDLEDLDPSPFLGVDIVTAGFPCPPFSTAGRRRGTDDERWIWPAIAELVRQVRPRQVFLENVPGILVPPAGQLAGLGHVLGDLAELGFDAEWVCVSAADVGAPHIRKRVFILAHAVGNEPERVGGPGLLGGSPAAESGQARQREWTGDSAGCGRAVVAHAEGRGGQGRGLSTGRGAEKDGAPDAEWRIPSVGHPDSGSRRARLGPGAGSLTGSEPCWTGGTLVDAEGGRRSASGRDDRLRAEECHPGGADTDGARRQGDRAEPSRPELTDAVRSLPIFPPRPDDADTWRTVLGIAPHLAPAVEPGLRGVAPRDAARLDRLHALGNGCVPLVAATAFVCLERRLTLHHLYPTQESSTDA